MNVNTDDFRAVVLENMAGGTAVRDSQERLVFMNATASEMLRWSEDELLGRWVRSLRDPVSPKRAQCTDGNWAP